VLAFVGLDLGAVQRHIKRLDDLHHEARQLIRRQPLVHRRRQQVRCVSVEGNDAAHRRVHPHPNGALTVRIVSFKGKTRQSDRLLGAAPDAGRVRLQSGGELDVYDVNLDLFPNPVPVELHSCE